MLNTMQLWILKINFGTSMQYNTKINVKIFTDMGKCLPCLIK